MMGFYKRPVTREEMETPRLKSAIALQNEYRTRIRLVDDFGAMKTIAGIDTGYDLERNLTKAVVALLAWPGLEPLTTVIAYSETDFPYVPGFLAFREVPTVIKALSCLPTPPDMLMVDGQGVAHPRRLGIAAHLGVETGLPAIGVAKSRLCGRHEEPGTAAFSSCVLIDKGEMVGTVLRSKERCNPLFVSAGHRVSQETALGITRACFRGYRLPEPTRIADAISKWKLGEAPVASRKTKHAKEDPLSGTGDLFD